jgi:hypothetical protein
MSKRHRRVEVLDAFDQSVDRDQRMQASKSGSLLRFAGLRSVIGFTLPSTVGSDACFYSPPVFSDWVQCKMNKRK